ncbi:FHA domain-containing protein [Stieleria sp. TO1_6]|uniref:FHA domain-containing protein n=1 Tax=Stieleria tagensis TaxID=2956795 RepID=UPI00209AC232|nr:FHA domain-containing protein [Stieleria tagensis]MCO8124659.1 FHA domain-containing protein [Stieleria tagensis]
MNPSTVTTATEFTLRIARQSASPIEHRLENGRSVFVGTSDSCGVQVKGDHIAHIHCLIDVDGDSVSIQDWASEAGTKVNGVAIEEKTQLQVGDSIVVGSVTIELDGKASTTGPKPITRNGRVVQPEVREESVGMEHLGVGEDSEHQPPVAAPPRSVSDVLQHMNVAVVTSTDEPTDEVALEPTGELTADSAAESSTEPTVELTAESTVEPTVEPPAETTPEPTFDLSAESNAIETVDDIAEDISESLSASEAPKHAFSAENYDWDPCEMDDEPVDAEIVQLLKSEIEDLRIQLAERDEQMASIRECDPALNGADASVSGQSADDAFGSSDLVNRVDDLLNELAEHDERVSTLQELLHLAEIQNQAEREERNCLENWVAEIEQRIGERESEWQAEHDALRGRWEAACQERDQFQQRLHTAAQRFGKSVAEDVVPDDTLKQLQQQNADLQSELDKSQKQSASLTRQIERLQTEDPEALQAERAELAQEKATVSRLRFQLSKQLQDIDSVPDSKEQPDREFAYKLQTLREHLREIHEEEKTEREQKGESLLGRISSLWKRVDDEY